MNEFQVRGALSDGGERVELQAYEWPAPPGAPRVFFAHATGFHARCWLQVVERLPDVHCFAIDMRGHGRSGKPEPPYRWSNFGKDVAAAVEAIGEGFDLAVGHSKGGYAITLAAALDPPAFRRLLLIDPVIMSKERYGSAYGQEHFAAKRRNAWASPREMYERFAGRPPFDRWDPAVLHDYCEYGLLPQGEGYVLACPPSIEAATYAGSSGESIYDEIESLQIPVRVLRARPPGEGGPVDMSGSPTAPDLASHFPRGEDHFLPQYSHFIPMEAPGFVAGQVREMLAVPA